MKLRVFSFLGLCVAAVGAEPLHAGRQLSDAILDDVIHNRSAPLFARLHPDLQATIGEAKVRATLDAMTKHFGKIVGYAFKTNENATNMTGASPIPVRRYWYAVTTTTKPRGLYFLVDVRGGTPLTTMAFSIVAFPKGVPKALQ